MSKSSVPENGQIREVAKAAFYYAADSTEYDAERWTSSAGNYNNATQLGMFRTLLPARSGFVAEVGCGTGRFTSELMTHTEDLLLIDVARDMLITTKKRTNLQHLVLASVTDIPLPNDTLDGLVCLNVLSHVPDIKSAVTEIGRVLKPHAFALLNFNNLASVFLPAALVVNRRGRALRADVYSRWITFNAFERLLRENGLRIAAVRGHMPVPSRVPTSLMAPATWLDRRLRTLGMLSPLPLVLAVKEPGRRRLRPTLPDAVPIPGPDQ